MIYDMDMLKAFYASYAAKVNLAAGKLGRPMTLTEKICLLYTSPSPRDTR